MIPRRQLRENIESSVETVQAVSMMTTVTLGAYQILYRFGTLIGHENPNLIEEMLKMNPGTLITASTGIAVAGAFLGMYLDSKPYKGVGNPQEQDP